MGEAKRKSYSLPELSTSFYSARTSVTAEAEQAALVEATRIGNEIDRTCALERETVSDTDLKSLRLMLSKANSNNNNNSPKSSNSRNNSGRIYVENPSDNDVLFGRGGRSNHHPGNARYRTEVERLSTTSKSDRLQMTKALAATIRASGGRFLQKERNVWYVVDNEEVVLKKVHQALRENRDPAKRKAKRKRFLERHNKRY